VAGAYEREVGERTTNDPWAWHPAPPPATTVVSTVAGPYEGVARMRAAIRHIIALGRSTCRVGEVRSECRSQESLEACLIASALSVPNTGLREWAPRIRQEPCDPRRAASPRIAVRRLCGRR